MHAIVPLVAGFTMLHAFDIHKFANIFSRYRFKDIVATNLEFLVLVKTWTKVSLIVATI